MLRAHTFCARRKYLGARYAHDYKRARNFLIPVNRIFSNHYPLLKMFYEKSLQFSIHEKSHGTEKSFSQNSFVISLSLQYHLIRRDTR